MKQPPGVPDVLIVDDSPDSRRLIAHLLESTGTQTIRFAGNGLEAIRQTADRPPSLILLDMEMPLMDGYAAARLIAAVSAREPIPVIAMTAHEGPEVRDRFINAGCADFIRKPLTGEALRACIDRFLPEQDHSAVIDQDIRPILPTFFRDRHEDVRTVRRLLEQGDFAGIFRIGHSMRGSGGGYGFPEISDIGGLIEQAAAEQNRSAVIAFVRRLESYLATVKVEYKISPRKASPSGETGSPTGAFPSKKA